MKDAADENLGKRSRHGGTENGRQSSYRTGHDDGADERETCALHAQQATSHPSEALALDERGDA